MTTPQRPVKPLPEESAALIISLSRHVNDESLQKLFNEIDTDNNGVIDTEELTTLLSKIFTLQKCYMTNICRANLSYPNLWRFWYFCAR